MSAALIVRDEEGVLGECLASLDGLVDEIVVYDTGSVDRTVAIARSCGATVVEGYWDDDFARARNAALAECRGEWVVSIDADEMLDCSDFGRLRIALWMLSHGELSAQRVPDGFAIAIDNVLLAEAGHLGLAALPTARHRAVRLFRREKCAWEGRLHEQVVGSGTRLPPEIAPLDAARIVHRGYAGSSGIDVVAKAERNLRVAEKEFERSRESGADSGYAHAQLARSLWPAGRRDEALVHARSAVRLAASSEALNLALMCALQFSLFSGEVAEAAGYLSRLEAAGEESRWWETGWLSRSVLHVLFGFVKLELGAESEWGTPVVESARTLSDQERLLLVAQSLNVPPWLGDRLLESALAAWPGDLLVLACAMKVSPHLPGDRAELWAERLEVAGVADPG